MKIFKVALVLGLLSLFTSCIVNNERIEPVNQNHQIIGDGGEFDDPVDPDDPN